MSVVRRDETEDWHVIVDGQTVYATLAWEVDFDGEPCPLAIAGQFQLPQFVTALRVRADKLWCITVILPTDAEEHGGWQLFHELEALTPEIGFEVMPLPGRMGTAEAVQTWKEMWDRSVPAA